MSASQVTDRLLRFDAQRIRERPARGSVILLYHRVAELRSDPWSLAVTPRHFHEHLTVLARHYRPVSLRDMVEALFAGEVRPGSVAITFDDGYADNLMNAKPALVRLGLPATFFVTVAALGQLREFWWDELDRILLQPGPLPLALPWPIGEPTAVRHLGRAARPSRHIPHRNRFWWGVNPLHPYVPRHRFYRSIYHQLQRLPSVERDTAMSFLREWAGDAMEARPTHRTLSVPELLALAADDLMEIGAHTLTHPVLAALSPSEQWHEIRSSKTRLEEWLGGPITSFSFPHGGERDYSADTVVLVRAAGFRSAAVASAGLVTHASDPWRLPRYSVGDWTGDEFAWRLARWVHSSGT